jgi:predicted nucleic acid-binding protein
MTEPTVQELAEKVRGQIYLWLIPDSTIHHDERNGALAALDALVARCEQAEGAQGELNQWAGWIHDALDGRPLPEYPDEAPKRIADLRARCKQAERERDEAGRVAAMLKATENSRLRAAEAEVDECRRNVAYHLRAVEKRAETAEAETKRLREFVAITIDSYGEQLDESWNEQAHSVLSDSKEIPCK